MFALRTVLSVSLGWRWGFLLQIPLFILSLILTSYNLSYVAPVSCLPIIFLTFIKCNLLGREHKCKGSPQTHRLWWQCSTSANCKWTSCNEFCACSSFRLDLYSFSWAPGIMKDTPYVLGLRICSLTHTYPVVWCHSLHTLCPHFHKLYLFLCNRGPYCAGTSASPLSPQAESSTPGWTEQFLNGNMQFQHHILPSHVVSDCRIDECIDCWYSLLHHLISWCWWHVEGCTCCPLTSQCL